MYGARMGGRGGGRGVRVLRGSWKLGGVGGGQGLGGRMGGSWRGERC